MDYQQKRRTEDRDGVLQSDDLFVSGITSGEGAAPEDVNPDISESIHAADDTISWDSQDAREYRGLGNRAINSPFNHIEQHPSSVTEHGLAEVVDLTMPPGVQSDTAQESYDMPVAQPDGRVRSLATLHDEKRSFGTEEVKLVDDAISKLNQDNRIADFYETVRGSEGVNA